MAKVPAQQLFQIVREVVRDEIRKALPQMVKECLTEQYIRKMVNEQAGGTRNSRSPSLSETLLSQSEDESQPEPLEPAGDGIYQKSPLIKDDQPKNEVVKRLLSKDNPLAGIYEGVKPLPREGETPAPGEFPAPLLEKIVDKNLMRRLAFGNQAPSPSKSDAAAEWEEQRLARLRESLDRPVNGGTRQAPRKMPQFASAPSHDDSGFPDAPIPGAL